jgi:AcrR family transcriptional regulator
MNVKAAAQGVPDADDGGVDGHRHGQVPRAVRNQQLLDIAEELFIARGFAATSIEDVARAAGVTRPVVYGHFGTKEGIYLACVRRARAEFQQALVEAVSAADNPLEQINNGSNVLLLWLEADPRKWRLLFASGTLLPPEYATQLEQMRFETIDQIAYLLRLGMPDAEPQRVTACAHAISGIGERLGHWWLANPSISRAEVLKQLQAATWAIVRDDVAAA